MTSVAREYPPLREIASVVHTFAVAPDNQHVVGIDFNGRAVCVWSLESGAEIRRSVEISTRVGATLLAVTPDGQHVIGKHAFDDDDDINIWATRGDEPVRVLRGRTRWIRDVVVTPDSRRMISGGFDETARVWSLESDRELLCFREHTTCVQALAVFQNMAVSGSWEGTIYVWTLDDGRVLQHFDVENQHVMAVTTADDGQYVVASYRSFMLDANSVRVWSVAGGHVIRHFAGLEGTVRSLATLPDGQHIVGGDDSAIRVWSLDSGAVLHSFSRFTTAVKSVAVSSDGKYIVGKDHDGTLRVYSPLAPPLQDALPGLHNEYAALKRVADEIDDTDSLVSLMLRGVLMQDTALRVRIVEKKLAAL